jgi:hypothetical protein
VARLTVSGPGQARALCVYDFGTPVADALACGVLQYGGTLVFGRESDLAALLDSAQITHVSIMAVDAERIARSLPDDILRPNLMVDLVGGVVEPSTRQLVRERFGARVIAQYWTPETDTVAVIGDDGVGTLVAGTVVRVLDENQNDVAPGRQGWIRARTDTMADGYYNDPDRTQARFSDGWFMTGDYGFMPTPATLVAIGQPDPLALLEERLRQIGGVSDAAVLHLDGAEPGAGLIVALEIPTGSMPAHVPATVLAIMQDAAMACAFLPLPWFPRSEAGELCRDALIELVQRRRSASMSDASPPVGA